MDSPFKDLLCAPFLNFLLFYDMVDSHSHLFAQNTHFRRKIHTLSHLKYRAMNRRRERHGWSSNKRRQSFTAGRIILNFISFAIIKKFFIFFVKHLFKFVIIHFYMLCFYSVPAKIKNRNMNYAMK